MSAFTKLLGQEYLTETIRDLVRDVLMSDPKGYEVDPSKTDLDPSVAVERLASCCQSLLDRIISSLSECPLSFRIVAKDLQVFQC